MDCRFYAGNKYCNLYQSKIASAYCGDICEERKPRIIVGEIKKYNGEKKITNECPTMMWPDMNTIMEDMGE